jgi:hypothetical protein
MILFFSAFFFFFFFLFFMSAEQVENLLGVINSPNASKAQRDEAQRHLDNFKSSDPSGYLNALCQIAGNDAKEAAPRMISCIQIKNFISIKKHESQTEAWTRWKRINSKVQSDIKTSMISVLLSRTDVKYTTFT